jgi:competence protein ComEC
VIYYFHQFPNYFWATNFLAIPAATVILTLGLFILSTNPIFPAISQFIGMILNKITSALNLSLNFIQDLPLSVSQNLYLEGKMIPFIYVMIILFSAFLLKRNAKALMIALSTITLILSLNIFKVIGSLSEAEFVVLNIPDHSVYNYIDHKTNVVFSGKPNIKKERLQFSAKNLWLKRNACSPELINLNTNDEYENKNMWLNENFLYIGGKKIFRLKNNQFNKYSAQKKLKVDYLIISEDAGIKIEKLCELFEFKNIIIDSSNSYYHRKRLIKKLTKHNLPYHSVVEEGAFHIQFL